MTPALAARARNTNIAAGGRVFLPMIDKSEGVSCNVVDYNYIQEDIKWM